MITACIASLTQQQQWGVLDDLSLVLLKFCLFIVTHTCVYILKLYRALRVEKGINFAGGIKALAGGIEAFTGGAICTRFKEQIEFHYTGAAPVLRVADCSEHRKRSVIKA